MDKYIKYEDIQECRFFQDERGEWILHADIIKIPAADVVPVRHGQWIKHYIEASDPHDRYDWQCSICETYNNNQTNYCPNCGAKMDGESNA